MITVNNKDIIDWYEGITISDILKIMNYDYSLISAHINDKYVPEEKYSETQIPDGASVLIIHLAHGG